MDQVERGRRHLRVFRIALVPREMTFRDIAGHVLGLPKSHGG